jgi:hypothetical protein
VKELRIQFVEEIPGNDAVLMKFIDPATCYAVASASATETDGEFLDVVLLPPQTAPPTAAVGEVYIKYRGVELTWRPGHATLLCEPEQVDLLLRALAEFSHYERELRRVEDEIAAGWTDLAQDKGLAFEINPDDLKRSDIVGGRMGRVLERRIRFARVEPHLYEAGIELNAAGQKLGAELRERTRIESRLETVDGQLEVYEHVYEMSGQRMGEYKAAREEHVLEWIIIALLAVETVALLVQMAWRLKP